jgi:hypothetical protein
MANLNDVRQKAIKITLNDGVEREVKFTLNAMAELEDKYGSADKAFEAMEKGSFKAIRTFLWAGLLHTEEGLTELQVGNLISMDRLTEIAGIATSAIGQDMPQAEQVDKVVALNAAEEANNPNE